MPVFGGPPSAPSAGLAVGWPPNKLVGAAGFAPKRPPPPIAGYPKGDAATGAGYAPNKAPPMGAGGLAPKRVG